MVWVTGWITEADSGFRPDGNVSSASSSTPAPQEERRAVQGQTLGVSVYEQTRDALTLFPTRERQAALDQRA
jgi:hypothetical protein